MREYLRSLCCSKSAHLATGYPKGAPSQDLQKSAGMAIWLWTALYIGALLAIVPLSHVAGTFPDGVLLYGRMHAVTLWIVWSLALLLAAIAAWKLARIDYRTAIAAQAILGLYLALGINLAPSSDAFMYQFYGQTLAEGKNPWGPLQLDASTRDPLQRLVVRLYGDHPLPSIYGPAFLFPEALLARAMLSLSLHSRLVAQRLLTLLAAMLLVFAIPRSRRSLWALNPFILFEAAVGAHNDFFMLLALAGAIRLRKVIPAGLAFGLAIMVKAAAVFAIFIRPRLVLGGALIVTAFAIIQPAAFTAYATLAHVHAPTFSILLTPLAQRFGILPAVPFVRIAIVLALLGLFVAMRNAKRNRAIPLALAAAAIPPLTTPWYGLWVAFSGAWSHRRAFTLAWWFPAILWLLYVIFWY